VPDPERARGEVADHRGHQRRHQRAYSMRPSTMNSRPNTAPASGVPNTEPKPPATPAASSAAQGRRPAFSRCETQSLRLAPICTAVPSRPALPPNRCVSTVPISTIGAIRSGSSGPSSWMVSITRLLPPLIGCLPKRS
jgi:hypothetical protein